MKKPVLPYVLKDSKYCGERPNCKASMEQATPPRRAIKKEAQGDCQVGDEVLVYSLYGLYCSWCDSAMPAWKAL